MGGNTTNLYGGSNQRGDINSSNITSTAGIVNTMYGGNNIGGNTANAKITINGGIVTETLYGGGNVIKYQMYLVQEIMLEQMKHMYMDKVDKQRMSMAELTKQGMYL